MSWIIGVGGFYQPVVYGDTGHRIRQHALNRTRAVRHGLQPKVVVVPTASLHWAEYTEKQCAQRLRDLSDSLRLHGVAIEFFDPERAGMKPDACREKLVGFDMVVLPGGNTAAQVSVWKRVGFDVALRLALDAQDIVVFGGSAGMAFAYDEMLTDSAGQAADLQGIQGLGWIEGSVCPHYEVARRHSPDYPDAAVEYATQPERRPQLVAAYALRPGAGVRHVALKDGKAVHAPLEPAVAPLFAGDQAS
ncbi:MAG: Type 1 glutamine amidotransferase-like domain-containing protein [Acidihalobacter sp.]